MSQSNSMNVKPLALLISACLLGAAPFVAAQESLGTEQASRAISLPAQSMDRTLVMIGRIGERIVRFDAAHARQLRAPAINAQSVAEALQQAVNGSGLSMTLNADNSYSIGQVSTQDLNRIVVTAVRDEAETSYSAQAVSSATRDGLSLRDQAQSTTIITARAMQDQQIQSVTDSLRNASGVTASGGVQGGIGYKIRGNTATATVGGLTSPYGNEMSAANLERVEVLKGPAAILSGSGNLGGVVNIVPKRPVAERLVNLAAETASYGEYKLTFDASNALEPSKRYSARLVAEYGEADRNSVGFDGRQVKLLAPSVRYKDEDTDILLAATYNEVHTPAQRFGSFVSPDRVIEFPQRIGPKNSGFGNTEKRIYFDATHRVNDWLTLASKATRSRNDVDLAIYAPVQFLDETTVAILKTDETQLSNTTATDTYARLSFNTGSFFHTLVGGYNYSKFVVNSYSPPYDPDDSFFVINDFKTADLSLNNFRRATVFNYQNIALQKGVYLQDTISVGDFHIAAGVRQSKYTAIGYFPATEDFPADRLVTSEDAVTRNFGVVYNVSPEFAIYANYLGGFDPSFATTADGSQLPPIRSTNSEVGFKAEMFEGLLSIVGSYYRLKQSDTVITDAATGFNRSGPGMQTKAFEIDVRGTLRPGWQVLATYSNGDYVYLDESATSPVVAQPERTYSLFTTYEIQQGAAKGLGGAIGVFGSSSSLAAAPDGTTFSVVPNSRELTLNLYYGWSKSRLNLGMRNLLDRDNFSPSGGNSYLVMIEPRSYRLTYSVDF